MAKVQKSLFGFEKESDDKIDKIDKIEKIEKIEKLEGEEENIIDEVEIKETKRANQIETDYYEKSRVEVCASRLRERFHVNIELNEVRYGSKPPLNEKIYGYYMLITIKSGDKDRIVEFIRNDCRLKVYN